MDYDFQIDCIVALDFIYCVRVHGYERYQIDCKQTELKTTTTKVEYVQPVHTI